jgi:SEC-C motif-containing protein
MRSRYAAYAVGDVDHLFRSWHPRTRPGDLALDPRTTWTGLEVLASGEEGETGFVEFRAHWRAGDTAGVLAEHSRFVRRAGRWVYLDGETGELSRGRRSP